MGLLSIIGTGAALLNYKKAKQEYETVAGEIDSLEKALYAAHDERLKEEEFEKELQAELDTVKLDEVDNPEALKVSTVCKVANLVGRLARARVQLVITNTGAKTYYIASPSVLCSVFENPIVTTDVKVSQRLVDGEWEDVMGTPEEMRYKIMPIQPGETKVIDFPKQIIGAEDGVFDRLRKIICHACNQKLITSCGKINITEYWDPTDYEHYNYLETATILFKWTTDEELVKGKVNNNYLNPVIFSGVVNKFKTANYRGVPGVFRYCMELSLIGE